MGLARKVWADEKAATEEKMKGEGKVKRQH